MIKKINRYFLLLLICLTGAGSICQTLETTSKDEPVRIEIPVKSTDESYHLIPLAEKGALLFYKSVETLNDSLTKWYFLHYDENLHSDWIREIPIKTGLEIRDFSVEKDTVTFLFLSNEKGKDAKSLEMIVRTEISSGKFSGTRHELNDHVVPVNFQVYRNCTFLAYNIKSQPAHLQVIDLISGKMADFQLSSMPANSNVTGFIVDTSSQCLYATLRKMVSKHHVITEILKISFSGTIVSETEVSAVSSMFELGNMQLILVNPDELLVIATYSGSGSSGKPGSLPVASGFFTCKVRNGVVSDLRFKNFFELKNFHNMVDQKDLIAIKRKAAKKSRSMSDYGMEVNLLVHPLIFRNDQIIVMGESFIPEYHPENVTEFDFYGRPFINTYNVFDGYRYTGAIIAGFDKTGILKWDNSMEIRNLISPELTPKVNIYCVSADTMVLCYSSEARIASKIIRESEVVEKLDFSAMEQMNPGDKMISECKNYMVPWYGRFFICYGFQEIKNINGSGNKRLVYYVTKVRFD